MSTLRNTTYAHMPILFPRERRHTHHRKSDEAVLCCPEGTGQLDLPPVQKQWNLHGMMLMSLSWWTWKILVVLSPHVILQRMMATVMMLHEFVWMTRILPQSEHAVRTCKLSHRQMNSSYCQATQPELDRSGAPEHSHRLPQPSLPAGTRTLQMAQLLCLGLML
jgi:hypothetical protein